MQASAGEIAAARYGAWWRKRGRQADLSLTRLQEYELFKKAAEDLDELLLAGRDALRRRWLWLPRRGRCCCWSWRRRS